MVKLTLVSPKGNQGVRFFPYQGYLGLTPLKFEGLVRTQIEQDGKPIPAKDIAVAVRCYESRQGRLGTVLTNVLYEYSVALWQKQDSQEWSELGDGDYPFRFSIPSHVAAPSTALYFQEYRIYWRIEAVLNHVPISGVGSRQVKYFDLPLIRYDLPASHSPLTLLTPPPSAYMTSLKSRGLPLRYRVLVPPNPIGPLDIVSVQLVAQPLDSSVSIRSATAFVERRICFSDFQLGPLKTPSTTSRFPSQPSTNHTNHSSNYIQDHSSSIYPESSSSSSQDLLCPTSSSSIYSSDSSRALLQHHVYTTDESAPHPSGDRGTTHIFAHAESSDRFSRDSSGVWRHNLTLSWPCTKSNSRWTAGETVQTGTTTVKYFLRVKLVVSSPASSAETVELEDKELTIVSTNNMQRQLALARYNEWVSASSNRSKSKSPRRSKRDGQAEQLPSPPHSPAQPPAAEVPVSAPPIMRQYFPPAHTHKISTASSPYPGSSSHKLKASRRPHTSAGPRDRPDGFDTRGYEGIQNQRNRLAGFLRPETARPTSSSNPPPSSRGFFRQKSVEQPRLGSSSSMSSGGHLTVESAYHTHGSLLFERVNQVEVEAWEQELARIESASRRSSADMRGFLSQRKKASVERPPILPSYLHADR